MPLAQTFLKRVLVVQPKNPAQVNKPKDAAAQTQTPDKIPVVIAIATKADIVFY